MFQILFLSIDGQYKYIYFVKRWFWNICVLTIRFQSVVHFFLSDITIWSRFTKSKLAGCLDLWNSFLITTILSNFSVFSLILILSKNKTHSFCNASFLYWINCWYLSLWFSLILLFFFFRQVFVSILWLLFYCFFVF